MIVLLLQLLLSGCNWVASNPVNLLRVEEILFFITSAFNITSPVRGTAEVRAVLLKMADQIIVESG